MEISWITTTSNKSRVICSGVARVSVREGRDLKFTPPEWRSQHFWGVGAIPLCFIQKFQTWKKIATFWEKFAPPRVAMKIVGEKKIIFNIR